MRPGCAPGGRGAAGSRRPAPLPLAWPSGVPKPPAELGLEPGSGPLPMEEPGGRTAAPSPGPGPGLFRSHHGRPGSGASSGTDPEQSGVRRRPKWGAGAAPLRAESPGRNALRSAPGPSSRRLPPPGSCTSFPHRPVLTSPHPSPHPSRPHRRLPPALSPLSPGTRLWTVGRPGPWPPPALVSATCFSCRSSQLPSPAPVSGLPQPGHQPSLPSAGPQGSLPGLLARSGSSHPPCEEPLRPAPQDHYTGRSPQAPGLPLPLSSPRPWTLLF